MNEIKVNMSETVLENEDKEEIPAPTTESAGNIKAIANDTVHKICSGQVVLSLAVAVKELVENSIDAGATLVEVKLREQGLESLEVSDNGSGVEEYNLQAMTAKYHTSKLREFVDLQGVETFGFRGEALSSLCALANMQITTRHKNAHTAIKIEMDHEGNIKQRSQCARAIGTTVILSDLFVTLPVRQRDFTRNIKKEFNKMCQLLQAYCLVSTGVRIICTNTTSKGVKTTVLQTHGVGDTLANVTAIFGSRQTTGIMRLKSPYSDESELSVVDFTDELGESMQLTETDLMQLNQRPFDLDGYVSSCSHGAGRAARDRQFFYINSRPCDHKNLSKVVNDIYHRYNAQQFPFVFLNIKIKRQEVDVNLTPDKRLLLIHNEQLLLVALKQALIKTYGNVPATFKMQNVSITSMLQSQQKVVNSEKEVDEDDDNSLPLTSTQNFIAAIKEFSGNMVKQLGKKRKCDDSLGKNTQLQKIQRFLSKDESEQESANESLGEEASSSNDMSPKSMRPIVCKTSKSQESALGTRLKFLEFNKEKYFSKTSPKVILPKKYKEDSEYKISDDEVEEKEERQIPHETITENLEFDEDLNIDEDLYRNCVAELNVTEKEIAAQVDLEQKARTERGKQAKLQRLRFKSEISPSQNCNAEAELQQEISKQDFARMQILGQFNLGFIIVRLDGDLFIVDQHATDEKYNFEMLQRNTVLQYQTLAVPQPLELTAVNEIVLVQHLPAFERNGFKFEINENAPATRRVRLLGKPFSKNWDFGKEDIDELIFMLQDAPEGIECRPSRIRAMFASRACRKSIMIGTALNKIEMRTLIRHMGDIEQPWNCPHGRPTMRHLINTDMLNDVEDEDE